MPARFVTITCPSCFEHFEIAAPPADELPAELDYDCEVCCRPLVVFIRDDGDGLQAEAHGINE